MKETYFPSNSTLEETVLIALKNLGGTADVPAINQEVIKIQNLYQELDRKFHLNGAKIPVTFGFETDSLGSYTRQSAHEKEHFHFSLLFVAYGVNNPLSKEDRIDLFKHEYAHYMQYNMRIPEKYKWQAGTHGSAWKYCCSLIGAAPTLIIRQERRCWIITMIKY